MHPEYKLQYFRDHEWLQEWVQVAEKLVRDEWEANYKPDANTRSASCQTTGPAGPVESAKQKTKTAKVRALIYTISHE